MGGRTLSHPLGARTMDWHHRPGSVWDRNVLWQAGALCLRRRDLELRTPRQLAALLPALITHQALLTMTLSTTFQTSAR